MVKPGGDGRFSSVHPKTVGGQRGWQQANRFGLVCTVCLPRPLAGRFSLSQPELRRVTFRSCADHGGDAAIGIQFQDAAIAGCGWTVWERIPGHWGRRLRTVERILLLAALPRISRPTAQHSVRDLPPSHLPRLLMRRTSRSLGLCVTRAALFLA